jgi:hypothetical protein
VLEKTYILPEAHFDRNISSESHASRTPQNCSSLLDDTADVSRIQRNEIRRIHSGRIPAAVASRHILPVFTGDICHIVPFHLVLGRPPQNKVLGSQCDWPGRAQRGSPAYPDSKNVFAKRRSPWNFDGTLENQAGALVVHCKNKRTIRCAQFLVSEAITSLRA